MSLADELLADLEEGEDVEGEPEDECMEEEECAAEPAEKEGSTEAVGSVRQLAKLHDSEQLKRIMRQVEAHVPRPRTVEEFVGPVESDPEYQLIVEANNLAVEIDNEIATVHKFCRDKYSKRFPELESLVVGPLEYMMTVRELGNELERAKNNEALQQFLTQATIMVVSVTASTTQGLLLSSQELERIVEACDMAVQLDDSKLRIYEFVESRMALVAPNLSAIVGASTAAKLMGVAGGLSKLSKMPACNVLVLGAQRKAPSGFTHAATLPHTGFVFHALIVQDTPPDMRRKAARLVANKCTMAARVDAFHESPDGAVGKAMREEIEKKLDKLQEAPPVKAVKPLPKPVDPPRKKRGGRRVRKMKERYAVTELRRAANRISFGEIEDDAYQADLGYSRGQLGRAGAGRVRMAQIDEKTKVRISKALQKNLQRQQHVWGGSTSVKKHVSGTASSVAFTPLQGLEIVNPQAAEKKASEANAKYFSNTARFVRLQQE